MNTTKARNLLNHLKNNQHLLDQSTPLTETPLGLKGDILSWVRFIEEQSGSAEKILKLSLLDSLRLYFTFDNKKALEIFESLILKYESQNLYQ